MNGKTAQERAVAAMGMGWVILLLVTGCGQSRGQERNAPECRLFGGEQRVTIDGYGGDAMEPFITKDDRYLLFNNRNEPPVNTDLFYARRIDALHFKYLGRIRGVNTPALEGVPSLDRNGMLYFVSPRDYDRTFSTLYQGHFANGSVTGVGLVPGVSRRQPGIVNFDAEISGDGNTLYFVDGDFTGDPKPKSAKLVIAIRQGNGFRRDPNSRNILRNVNEGQLVYAPAISTDGLELFFTCITTLPATMPPTIYRAVRAQGRAVRRSGAAVRNHWVCRRAQSFGGRSAALLSQEREQSLRHLHDHANGAAMRRIYRSWSRSATVAPQAGHFAALAGTSLPQRAQAKPCLGVFSTLNHNILMVTPIVSNATTVVKTG